MRYISEEELRKWLITDGCEEGHGYIDEDDFVCMDWQDNPIKTGKWILIDKELSRYKCSECGEVIKLHKKSEILSLEKDEILSDYPFSHCGARMIESEVEE